MEASTSETREQQADGIETPEATLPVSGTPEDATVAVETPEDALSADIETRERDVVSPERFVAAHAPDRAGANGYRADGTVEPRV